MTEFINSIMKWYSIRMLIFSREKAIIYRFAFYVDVDVSSVYDTVNFFKKENSISL